MISEYRSYFAGLALQGILANGTPLMLDGHEVDKNQSTVAMAAVRFADALIAELAKPCAAPTVNEK